LAKLLNTSYSVIGKYERDEMLPSIEAAKKIAGLIDTTVGYLLDETEETNLFKDPVMLKRLTDINALPEDDKGCLLRNVDAFLRDAKTRQAYS
jgi:transcriptional regulator with XRE-family HTH domain